jgi:crotonobetainyl-CoA:carnitine CoA-transferase CaiB-like acyl-CoA transferase
MGDNILSGLRVIDAGTYIAGPCSSTVMADFGAEVIKIERPPAGDPYRALHTLPGMPVAETDYCWLLDNRNKRSLALNIAEEAGREVLIRLVRNADVLVTNYQPQMIRRFRLSYEELSAENPRLIYASVTGYGEVGEEAEKPGFDTTAYWARSGLMDIMHNSDAEPARSPAGFGDHPTSMALFGAVMMALYHRERTGRGSKVLTSLMANGVWSNGCAMQAALLGAKWPVRTSRKDPLSPLVNHYLSRDGARFMLCLLNQQAEWPRLCAAIGQLELAGHEKFRDIALREANRRELVFVLDEAFAREDMAEWVRRFQQHEVLWGPVATLDQLARDPQLDAAGVIAPVAGTPWRTISSPIQMAGRAKEPAGMPPGVGEHSKEILESLGYSPQEIAALADRGITL